MSDHEAFLVIPVICFIVAYTIMRFSAVRIYKRMNPDKDFDYFEDQLFMFRKIDKTHPLASKFQKRRIAILAIILIAIIHGIWFRFFIQS